MPEYNTSGYYAIMAEAKTDIGMNRDYGLNTWDSNMNWLTALSDYMWHWCGEVLPGANPAPGRFQMDALRGENPELDVLMELINDWEDDDIRQVYKVLSRYDGWLRAAGKDY